MVHNHILTKSSKYINKINKQASIKVEKENYEHEYTPYIKKWWQLVLQYQVILARHYKNTTKKYIENLYLL